MKTVTLLSRVFTGLLFVFSGFVKAVDPSGFAIKLREYFEAFHLDWFVPVALPLAILLCSGELVIGLNLLAGARIKLTAWMLLLFMSFFTVLTFILAIANPVNDCGCFGDALKLTNWQTFGKNIILFIPTLIVFIRRDTIGKMAGTTAEWAMTLFNFCIACGISLFCIRHQPILDFRPYRIGTNIPEKMIVPEGSPVDEYKTILVYRKKGRQQEFTDKNFPWQDTTWKWVETKQKLIKKGYEPPIHDFSITSPEGVDITQQILADSGYIFLFISPNLEKASVTGFQMLNSLALRARELGFRVIGLTASAGTQLSAFNATLHPAFDFCTADETTLKTIVRANPGVLLLHQGTVIGKWNFRDAPKPGDLNKNLLSIVLLKQQRQSNEGVLAALALSMLLLYAMYHRIRVRNYTKNPD